MGGDNEAGDGERRALGVGRVSFYRLHAVNKLSMKACQNLYLCKQLQNCKFTASGIRGCRGRHCAAAAVMI